MFRLRYFFRAFCVVVALSLTVVSLGSCGMARNQFDFDRATQKEVQDYRDALLAPDLPPENASAAPDFRPIVSMPAELKLPTPLVSVSVNQSIGLSDLLFELAEQANVDLELDPQIQGSLIFTAKERPFSEVVQRICDMAGLRYTFKDNILRIEVDRPYVKNYRVDYMNISRKSGSSIKSDLSVSGGGASVSSGTASNANISNTFTSSLWKELDDGLKQILAASDTYMPLSSLTNPVATSAQGAAGAPATMPPPLPAAPGDAGEEGLMSAPATYSISKETGIVSIFASERQHKMVAKFLDDFRRVSTMQVLIEAKVLEVGLTDEYAAGIDWGAVRIGGVATLEATTDAPAMAPAATNFFRGTFKLGKGGINPVVQALNRFGTVRALSSPRVTVMNSQPAVVNVTNNTVYFDIQTTTIPCSPTPCTPTTNQTSTLKSVPEGVLMNVLPTANPDTGEILLAVRPTVAKVVNQVEDPINAGNLIPELSVQEIDSIVKIQSGQTIVMGGLMKDSNTVGREGVPVLDSLPVVGNFFRNHGDQIQKSELVILLSATIVPGSSDTITDEDRKIYKEFSQDRHPVRL